MNVKQVLNQIQDSTLGETRTNNLIKYLYDDIINEYGGGYDYFVESYSSEVGRFDEQRDVEIIESLYCRRVYSPNSNIQEHELKRLEGLLDICQNKLNSGVWSFIEKLMVEKSVSEMDKEEFNNWLDYGMIEDWLYELEKTIHDLKINNQYNLDEWRNGFTDDTYRTFSNKVQECIGVIGELDRTIISLTKNLK